MSTSTDRTRSVLPALGVFALLHLIPLLGTAWLGGEVLQEMAEGRKSAFREEIEAHLQLATLRGEPKDLLFRAFQKGFSVVAGQGFRQEGNPGQGVREPILPAGIEGQVCLYTPAGELVEWEGKRLGSRFLLGKLWEDLREFRRTSPHERMYRSFLGVSFVLRRAVRNEGVIHDIGPGSQDGILLWKRGPGRSGLLMIIPSLPQPWAVLKTWVAGRKTTDFWGLYDPVRSECFPPRTATALWNDLDPHLASGQHQQIDAGGWTFARQFHPDGFQIVLGRRAEPSPLDWLRPGLWLICLLLGAGACLDFAREGTMALERLRLSPRILGLFLLAGFLPTLLLVRFGLQAFQERALTLQQQLETGALGQMRQWDRRYTRSLEDLLTLFRRMRDHPWLRQGDPRLLGLVQPLNLERRLANVLSYDRKGFNLFFVPPGGPELQLVELFSREVMRRYLGLLVSGDVGMGGVGSQVLLSPGIGLGKMFDFPDTLTPMNLGGQGTFWYWYWDVIPLQEQATAAMIVGFQLVPFQKDIFLRSLDPRQVRVFDTSLCRWSPEEIPDEQSEALVARAVVDRRAASRLVRRGDRVFLSTAGPSTVLPEFCYLMEQPYERVLAGLERLRLFFALAVGLTLLTALLFARLLSRSFLGPIVELGLGVERLEKGNFTERVGDLGRDELGHLGEALNRLGEERRALAQAQQVQRDMIPPRHSTFGACDLSLVNTSLSELGGDYCDAMPMADGRLFLVMGDVTGHGVSAALLTAMAKAVLLLTAQDGLGLADLLNRLNRVINLTVHREHLMTMVAGVLDPRSGAFEWSCAGHVFPIELGADGTLKYLQMSQYPLGARLKNPWKTEKMQLQPGTTLLFYTDGLVEGSNQAGEPFGFDRLEATFRQCGPHPTPEVLDGLVQALRAYTAGTKAQDDLTLMVLRFHGPLGEEPPRS